MPRDGKLFVPKRTLAPHRSGVYNALIMLAEPLSVHIVFTRPEARSLYGGGEPAFLAPATSFSVGFDLRACLDADSAEIEAGERLCVPTGIAVQPESADVAGFVYSRSGLGAREGLSVAQGVGVIDPDYTGEILVYLLNTSKKTRIVRRGDRIAQLVFQPVRRPVWTECDALSATGRGAGGFGHTGRR